MPLQRARVNYQRSDSANGKDDCIYHALLLVEYMERAKMMTVVAIMAALLPILRNTWIGSEVMSHIAAPMAGGMIFSTILTLTLTVIPAIYGLVKQWRLARGMEAAIRPRS